MILIDSSVLIRYLKTASASLDEILERAECGICGLVRAEVLHGARTPDEATELSEALDAFAQLPTLETTWDRLGSNLAALRAKGLPTPFQDVLLATVAIEHGAELWSYDSHFSTIQSVVPELKLFAGPTV